MVKMIQRIRYIFIFCLILPFYANAQTGAPSAYTTFGVGTLNKGGLVKNQGMGGTGLALKTDNFINALNPASLTGIDSLNMLIDLGLRASKTFYKTNEGDGNAVSGGLNNISLAFRSASKLYTSFGLNQFSSVGYNVSSTTDIQGSMSTANVDYTGTGGINEVYLSNAYALNKNISVGLKIAYLFGNIDKTETFTSSSIGSLNVNYSDYVQQFVFEPGLQYQFNLKDNVIRLGGTFRPEVDMANSRTVEAYASSGAGISDELDDGNDYKIPMDVAGGISWANKKGLTLACDYRFQQWSQVKYSSKAAELKDSHRFSGGAEFRNRETKKANPFLYQAGAYVEDTYIRVEGNSIIDYGVSAGVGIPMRNSKSYFNINLNYGRRGTRGGDVITENYFGLNLSMSFVEFWFMKRQFD